MRRKTTTVRIGEQLLSDEQPVMIQSMLNTPTMNVEACVEQAIRIIQAGGQLVRITAPGVKEAEKLKDIHTALQARGYTTPLSADIHFTPDAASVAARYVEKVRINPGNFADKRATFKQLSYTDAQYAAELEVLRKKFSDFLQVCREHHTAVRIGTNHGSLSDRILSRYGDTPAGMVESTLEYLRICQAENFNDVVISLKSSDCQVMVDAVRLLVEQMEQEGMSYPLHLGVTEAGEGEDGRIRSAVGIGTLLNEGIGDTIRVSLTEAPEAEIPVAQALADLCRHPEFEGNGASLKGIQTKPVIVADLSCLTVIDETVTASLGFIPGQPNDPVYGDRLHAGDKAPELIYTETLGPELTKLPEETRIIVPAELFDMAHVYNRNACPLYGVEDYLSASPATENEYRFVRLNDLQEWSTTLSERLKKEENTVIVLAFPVEYRLYRRAFRHLQQANLRNKILVQARLKGNDREWLKLSAASQTGGFFLDRLAWGIWLTASEVKDPCFTLELSRNILQSAGVRRYKAEFISCPGCGRTLFDLQGAVAQVKAAFGHLHTLKIAVMGCVVNGPGEMGDADYGYVGAGNGKVNLYKGRRVVRVAVPEAEAIEALRALIEQDLSHC